GQLLVLGHGLGQLALGLQELLLEGAHPLGRLLEAPPQRDHFLFEDLGLLAELGDLALVGSQPPLLLGVGHDHLLSWANIHRPRTYYGDVAKVSPACTVEIDNTPTHQYVRQSTRFQKQDAMTIWIDQRRSTG